MKKSILVIAISAAIAAGNALACSTVNVNSADAATIANSLDGIGQKKATNIVDDRSKNGNFSNADDLKRVSGIGDKTVEKNRACIQTDEPKADESEPEPEPAKDDKDDNEGK